MAIHPGVFKAYVEQQNVPRGLGDMDETLQSMVDQANRSHRRMRELYAAPPWAGRLEHPDMFAEVYPSIAERIEAGIARELEPGENPHSFDRLPMYEHARRQLAPELHSGRGVSQAIAAAFEKHATRIARNMQEYDKGRAMPKSELVSESFYLGEPA